MSSKSIKLYESFLASQGRAPKAPINIMGFTPREYLALTGVKVRVKKSRAPIAGKVNQEKK